MEVKLWKLTKNNPDPIEIQRGTIILRDIVCLMYSVMFTLL